MWRTSCADISCQGVWEGAGHLLLRPGAPEPAEGDEGEVRRVRVPGRGPGEARRGDMFTGGQNYFAYFFSNYFSILVFSTIMTTRGGSSCGLTPQPPWGLDSSPPQRMRPRSRCRGCQLRRNRLAQTLST